MGLCIGLLLIVHFSQIRFFLFGGRGMGGGGVRYRVGYHVKTPQKEKGWRSTVLHVASALLTMPH